MYKNCSNFGIVVLHRYSSEHIDIAIEELKFHEFIQCIDTKVDKHRYKIGLKIVI